MRIKPTPQQLLAFLRVVETGSFSRAADSMGLSQPALSRTIKAIEEAIGARLFNRDTRNVELTSVGAELRPIAKRLVKEFDRGLCELSQFVAGERGHITIAALPSVAAALLPRVVARFQGTNPGVDIAVRDGLSQRVLNDVLEGTADLGLTVPPSPSVKLAYKPLLRDEFCLVCRRNDPLALSDAATWSAFGQLPYVAMSPASSVRVMTDAAFLQIGLAIKPLYECEHLATAGGLVAAGLGITALPRLALPVVIGEELASLPLLAPVLRRSIGVVTRAGQPLSQSGQILLAALEAEARLWKQRSNG